MNNYKRLEKSRYVKVATSSLKPEVSAVIRYRGHNPFRIFLRKAVKAVLQGRMMLDHKLYISNIAVVTSFACNLNCYGCGQHTPQIKQLAADKRKIDFDQICKDLDKILLVVDGIGGIALANGEGFLNPNLNRMMDYFAKTPKIHSMNVPTNGTIIPNEETLTNMSNHGVTATITRYDCVDEAKRTAVQQAFEQHHVYYSVFEDRKWYLHEYVEDEICDDKEAAEKYCECERFFMLMQGRLWKCVTNATGIKAGVRPERMDDSICVETATLQELRQFIIEKNNLSYLESCKHCRGSVGSHVKEIVAGEQLK